MELEPTPLEALVDIAIKAAICGVGIFYVVALIAP